MAHELEFDAAGNACMVYSGETPWHSHGTRVSNDLSPEQMMQAAGVDWEVRLLPAIITLPNGDEIPSGHSGLVRSTDNRVLDVVTDDWNPTQNLEAFEFFNEFVAAGDMSMETAGSLKDGQIVWALAKVNESFELFGGRDKVDAYLHFTNFHQYGRSTDVRFTGIRCVCWNTVSASLNSKSKNFVKASHRTAFNGDRIKETMGITRERLAEYKEVATFLSTKRSKNEDIVEYFKRVFPILTTKDTPKKELSKSADLAISQYLHTQPGAELGEGTWWANFNCVTYMVDHIIGRGEDSRLTSAWYGANSNLKTRAMELAVEMAG